MPTDPKEWFEETADQLAAFTGEDGAEDDIADAFGIIGRLVDEFAAGDQHDDYTPELGSDGFSGGMW